MKKFVAGGLLALGGLMTTAVGVAHADEVEAEGDYPTEAACDAAAPGVELAWDNHLYSHWVCRPGPDGLWHVFLNNG